MTQNLFSLFSFLSYILGCMLCSDKNVFSFRFGLLGSQSRPDMKGVENPDSPLLVQPKEEYRADRNSESESRKTFSPVIIQQLLTF